LQNPAYLGTAKFGKTHIGPRRSRPRPQRNSAEQPRRAYSVYASADGGVAIDVPALVSEELFAAVAEQLAENRRRARQRQHGARYLLQGLLVCHQCGYALYGKPVSPAAAKGKLRQYAYYRCIGTDAYRFGGQRVCCNKQVRTDALEKAVWQDVCALLNDPAKVAEEYQRRLSGKAQRPAARSGPSVTKLIQKVRRGIARLIDAYAEDLLDKGEFEPRICSAKERLAKLEVEARAQAEAETQEQELRLVIGHLQEFADRVQSGLMQADWSTRRKIIRALVKRVEVDQEVVRVVYRVSPFPFVESPDGGIWQDCGRRGVAVVGQPLYAPLRSGLEGAGTRGPAERAHRQLCGRLRDLLSSRRRLAGDGRDADHDVQAAVDGEREEDASVLPAGGHVHVFGVHVRQVLLAAYGRGVYRPSSGGAKGSEAVSEPERAHGSANVPTGHCGQGANAQPVA